MVAIIRAANRGLSEIREAEFTASEHGEGWAAARLGEIADSIRGLLRDITGEHRARMRLGAATPSGEDGEEAESNDS